MDQVSIVIVNWNTGKLLAACLESLAKLPKEDRIHHVVVVDNASSDTSLSQAKHIADTAGYTLLPQQENLGFAKANNIGISYIHQHGGQHDHILLLNPDTEVPAHAIEHMLSVLEKDSRIGIVGPKLLDASGNTQASVRTFPTLAVFIMLFLKMQRLIPNSSVWNTYMMTDFDYSQEAAVDQVMGAAFLIRNTVLEKIGTLDESFWIWFEEVDYCKRTKDAAWRIVYTPSATIKHYGGVSFGHLVGPSRTIPLLNSSLVYAKKHLGFIAMCILIVLYPIGVLASLPAAFAHMRQKNTLHNTL